MIENITNLINSLEEEVNLYRDLLSLVKKTQHTLTKNNLEELNKLLDTQQVLIIQAAKLEERRQEDQGQLADLLALSKENLTFSEIIEKTPEQFQDKLKELQETLLELVEKINVTNQQNEVLIKDSLKYIDYSMKLMAGESDTGTYEKKPSEEKKDRSNSKLFDKRI